MARNRKEELMKNAPAVPGAICNVPMEKPLQRKVLWNKLLPFTEALACEYIEMTPFVGERPRSDSHVSNLVREARLGRFLGENALLASCECVWDGKIRRLNGQHTSWMRLYMPHDWDPMVVVRRYRVQTEAQFRDLYSVYDRLYGRTNRQVVGAKLYGTKQYKGVSVPQLDRLATGLRIWKSTVKDKGQPIDETVDAMSNGSGLLAKKVNTFMSSLHKGNAPHMVSRAGIVGAMFATFNKSAKDSVEFWTIVRDGGGLVDHPAQALMKYLMSVKIYTSNSTATARHLRPTSRERLYRCCISAWNRFREGKSVSLLREPAEREVVK